VVRHVKLANGGLQTMYNRLRVFPQHGPNVSYGDMPTSFQCLDRSCSRSSAHGHLAVLRTKTSTYVPHSFAVSGPTSWYSLPQSFHDATSTLGQCHCGL